MQLLMRVVAAGRERPGEPELRVVLSTLVAIAVSVFEE